MYSTDSYATDWENVAEIRDLAISRQVSGCNRRARENYRQPDKVTVQEIKIMYAWQRGQCFYCMEALCGAFDIEHVTPLSNGGRNAISNIVLACSSCNSRKHTSDALEFLHKRLGEQGITPDVLGTRRRGGMVWPDEYPDEAEEDEDKRGREAEPWASDQSQAHEQLPSLEVPPPTIWRLRRGAASPQQSQPRTRPPKVAAPKRKPRPRVVPRPKKPARPRSRIPWELPEISGYTDWSAEEDAILVALYGRGEARVSEALAAGGFGRTRTAIRARAMVLRLTA